MTDEDFARAFAPLFEVKQRGKARQATPNDILEFLCPGAARYVLKGHGRYYIASDGKGWTELQSEALVVPDRAAAYELRRQGREKNIDVRVVRFRRPGTSALEGARLRPDIDVREEAGKLSLGVSAEEALGILTALTGAKEEGGPQ